jgi:hypothetical protein
VTVVISFVKMAESLYNGVMWCYRLGDFRTLQSALIYWIRLKNCVSRFGRLAGGLRRE